MRATSDVDDDNSALYAAYPEWPACLGDPHVHVVDDVEANAEQRQQVTAHFRKKYPLPHNPEPFRVKEKVIRRPYDEAVLRPRKCAFRVNCKAALATKKCFNCAKFAADGEGYYCDECFEARHPSYRLEHSWIPLDEHVNQNESWLAQVAMHHLEQDAQELKLLLEHTQQYLRGRAAAAVPPPPLEAPPKLHNPTGEINFKQVQISMTSIDTTIREMLDQVHYELAQKPGMTREEALHKIHAMWRLRKARKQVKELIRNVFESYVDPTTGQTYYFNTKTKETQWTKPKGLGKDNLQPATVSTTTPTKTSTTNSRKSSTVALASLDRAEQERIAVARVQGMARARIARNHMRTLISSVYEKIWDESSERFYYHNTRTKEVKWERPRWVSDAELPTPRQRLEQERKERREGRQLTQKQAAVMVQRVYRKRRGFEMLLRLSRAVYERIYDPTTQRYYYHNTRTKETSWDKPLLLRNAKADVLTPRTRQQQLQALMNVSTTLNKPKRDKVVWTEDTAAVRLQGLFRARKARQQLAVRLVDTYKKIKDDETGLYYYYNVSTGVVTWEAPALVRKAQVEVNEWDGE
ncbi:TPA: hypothetical protein N0F65_007180 [Lagenidium giganteum]|uniref:WW domain-containing protein n=1 Tax=Lagenidium giganteum TaxID=4803 RepID=A0AAV2Z7Q7_9STRA|nr:TPA: hypothetical protein N0F65_007180 [Lagenidium giganteum]